MRYRTIKRKIMRAINSNAKPVSKYLQMRNLFFKQFEMKRPKFHKADKEKLQDAILVIRKIYYDEDMETVFRQSMKSSANPSDTSDFIEFMEKISK